MCPLLQVSILLLSQIVTLSHSYSIIDNNWEPIRTGQVRDYNLWSVTGKSIEECMALCQANSSCLSIDRGYGGKCLFNNESWVSVPSAARPDFNFYAYLERSPTSQPGKRLLMVFVRPSEQFHAYVRAYMRSVPVRTVGTYNMYLRSLSNQ